MKIGLHMDLAKLEVPAFPGGMESRVRRMPMSKLITSVTLTLERFTHAASTVGLEAYPHPHLGDINSRQRECGGALPQGQCLVALRRTAQNGKDEDWKAYGPGESGHYGSGPGVMWENPDFPTPHLTNVKVDYFCKGR